MFKKYLLIATAPFLMLSNNANAAAVFSWDDVLWSDGDTTNTFVDVGSSGIDIKMTLSDPNGALNNGDNYPKESNEPGSRALKIGMSDTIANTALGMTFTIEFFVTGTTTEAGVTLSDLTVFDIDQNGIDSPNWQEQLDFSIVGFGGDTSDDGTLVFSGVGSHLNLDEATDTVGSKHFNNVGDRNPPENSPLNRATISTTSTIQELSFHYTNIQTGRPEGTQTGSMGILVGGFSFAPGEATNAPEPSSSLYMGVCLTLGLFRRRRR